MTETFGEALRRHRLAASLTQEALAERAAISATAIAALERGRRKAPRLTTLRQIALGLGLGADDLATLAALADQEPERAAAPSSPPHRSPSSPTVPAGPAARPGEASGRLPGPAARRWRTELVGRHSQLSALVEAWKQGTRLVTVAGEAGIGKTRLASELARVASADGATVAWGRCTEDGMGAYLPFAEVVRHVVGSSPAGVVAAAVGERGDLLRVMPELERVVGPLPVPTRGQAGAEQHHLFEAVAGLLEALGPLLVVLDDLQWADEATAALLGYLVRRPDPSGLVVVATVRDGELPAALAALLADLRRHADTRSIVLRRLGGADLGALVEGLVGSPVAAEVIERVRQATEGNPFFAEEMTVHLVDSGALEPGGAGAARGAVGGIPAPVRDMLAGRLLALPVDALELALIGGIVGREFDLSVVGPAAGLAGGRLVDAVDDCLLSGLVEDQGRGRFAFTHAIVRHAVVDRLSSARAAALHRRVAEALEASPGGEAPAADLARHWAAVAEVDPTAAVTAATWAVRAGDDALAKAAADEAIARYEQASSLWAEASAGHADALVRLGNALAYRGRADEADRRFREALALASALGDRQMVARAAIGLGRRYPYWESDTARIDVLEQALAGLDDQDRSLRLPIMGLLVTQMINGIAAGEAGRRDELAEAVAAVADDPETSDELLAAIGATRIYDCYEDPACLRAVAARLARLGSTANDLRLLAVARFSEALAALDLGSMAELRQAAARFADIADRLGDPRDRSQSATVQATIALIEGRYADSEKLSGEAVGLGRESGDYNADLVFFAQGLLRAVDCGQAGDVLPLLLDATDFAHIGAFRAGTALCAALAGQRDVAARYVDELLATGLRANPRGADRTTLVALMAHACVAAGLGEQAAAVHEALERCRVAAVRIGPMIGWWGPVDHHRGSLLRVLGRPAEAEVALRNAIDLADRMGATAFSARSRGELARLLAGSGRQAPAEVLRSEALALAGSIGAAGVASEAGAT